jgi:hypothetical protein
MRKLKIEGDEITGHTEDHEQHSKRSGSMTRSKRFKRCFRKNRPLLIERKWKGLLVFYELSEVQVFHKYLMRNSNGNRKIVLA